MPTYYARATGNVNAAIWATTPTGTASNLFSSFTNADVLMANSFTVTLNVNTTVAAVRNDTTDGATAGGSFNLNDGVTLTANVFCGTTQVVSYNGSAPNSAAIVGTLNGGLSGAATQATVHQGSGTLNVTGTVIGGTLSSGIGLISSGVLNIVGNVNGSAVSGASGVRVAANGTVNITGTVTGGVAASSGAGLSLQSTCTANVFGVAVGGVAGEGVAVNSGTSPVVSITRARGNGFGNGSVGLSAAAGVSVAGQGASVRVQEIEYGALGQSPTAGPIIINDSTSNVAIFYRTSGGPKTLTDPAATVDFPANSNVRSGTVFANGSRTGTCVVPAASNVALGVAVDNTTGTAVLTQANVNTALAGFSDGRLANCATVASTGQQLADAMTM